MEIFSTGGLYQTAKISIVEAINQTQAIADRIWLDLDLSDDFEVLRFLRDQAGEQTGEQEDTEANEATGDHSDNTNAHKEPE